MTTNKLLARGSKLTLTDGRVVHARFGMRELADLEDKFGSIVASQEALESGKTFKSTVEILAIAVAHEGITLNDLWDLLEPARFADYFEVIGAAMGEAFPSQDGPGNSEAGATTGSPSDTGSTSPSSSSAGPNKSSGI